MTLPKVPGPGVHRTLKRLTSAPFALSLGCLRSKPKVHYTSLPDVKNVDIRRARLKIAYQYLDILNFEKRFNRPLPPPPAPRHNLTNAVNSCRGQTRTNDFLSCTTMSPLFSSLIPYLSTFPPAYTVEHPYNSNLYNFSFFIAACKPVSWGGFPPPPLKCCRNIVESTPKGNHTRLIKNL